MDSSRIHYFPLDDKGRELDPILIDLAPDGSANLAQLPEEVRQPLEIEGVGDQFGNTIFPKDGVLFLYALVSRTNPYFRFRPAEEYES